MQITVTSPHQIKVAGEEIFTGKSAHQRAHQILTSKDNAEHKLRHIIDLFAEVVNNLTIQGEIIEALEQQNDLYAEDNKKHLRKHIEIAETIIELNNQINQLAKEKQRLIAENTKLAAYEDEASGLQSRIDGLSLDLIRKDERLRELERQYEIETVENDRIITKQEELSEKVLVLADRVDQLAAERGFILEENHHLQLALQKIHEEKAELTKQQKVLQVDVVELESKVDELTHENHYFREALQNFEEQFAMLEQSHQELKAASALLIEDKEILGDRLADVDLKNEELSDKINDLEKLIEEEAKIRKLQYLGRLHRDDGNITQSLAWMTFAACISASAPIALAFGAGVYAVNKVIDDFKERSLERKIQTKLKSDPKLSRIEAYRSEYQSVEHYSGEEFKEFMTVLAKKVGLS